MDSQKHQLDKFDQKLVIILQKNADFTSQQLGEMIGLSPTSVQRRIKSLRKRGIIDHTIAVISPKAMKHNLFLVMIELERGGADTIDRMKRTLSSYEQVLQCYYTLGTVDFVVVVSATSIQEYEAFTREAFFNQKMIRRFTTMPVMDTVKAELPLLL